LSTAGPSRLPAYVVAEESTFEASAQDVEPDAERFDELVDDLKWRLALDPYFLTYAIPGRGTRVTFEETEHLTLRVFFWIEHSERRVALAWVDEAESDEEERWQ
jgi:hypothetical protein